jgi:hypothetical protein
MHANQLASYACQELSCMCRDIITTWQVEKVMRALYVRRLRLWPRFQDDVQAAMDASPPEVCMLGPQLVGSLPAGAPCGNTILEEAPLKPARYTLA